MGRLSELKNGEGGKPGRIPVELRREAVALLSESGLSLRKFGERIGMSRQTMCSWRQAVARLSRKREKRRFREVRVVSEKGLERMQMATRSFELSLAGGARIRGLSMEDVARLLSVHGEAQ